ncbi:hypothetical protein FB45DRAFT_1064487 [Roridomyces roridus]|uniref:BRCT domain-containing protein n=1 Tax=Roridomyces roridus TaxID=1738132 RepID=A0AAD7BAK2_9AGAR|nr:hypothetical protein FB45DRAFT_1064487 [Roridomyces roridus]
MPDEQIFRGVLYMISLPHRDASASSLLKQLLEKHGGKQASDSREATRIITSGSEALRQRSVRCPGVIVTPEWVYNSVKTGVKQAARYYSAEPELFFASIVVAADSEIEPSCVDEYRRAVMQHGGQWVDTPTDATTHIISPQSVPGGPVVISEQRLLDSITRKERLPFAIVDGQEVSAARCFCDALLAARAAAPITAAAPTTIGLVDLNHRPPLPHFPYEILAKIFLMTKEIVSTWGSNLSLFNLTHVCSRWRSVAHDTPQLWTHIHMRFHSKKSYHRLLNMANQWRDLSGSLPIMLQVNSVYPRGHRNPVIDWIIENAARIRSLRLTLPEPHFHPLLQHPSVSFSALDKLTLFVIPKSMTIYRPEFLDFDQTRDDYFEGDCPLPMWNDKVDDAAHSLWHISPMNGFRDAPQLRSLTIDADMSGSFSSSMLDLVAWNQLTDIDLRAVSIPVFDIPDLLPNSRVPEPSVPPMAQVTLPLTKLYFETADDLFDRFSAASFLDVIVLPDLESLEMRTQSARDDGEETGLIDLYPASAFELQHLTLHSFALSFANFSPLLREMSSLTSLELVECITVDDDLMTFLIFDAHDAEPVMPALEVLKLRGLSPRFSESVMMQMVESRWTSTGNSPTPLRCVSIAQSRLGEGEDHRKVMDWVLQIAEAGLDIHYDRGF